MLIRSDMLELAWSCKTPQAVEMEKVEVGDFSGGRRSTYVCLAPRCFKATIYFVHHAYINVAFE